MNQETPGASHGQDDFRSEFKRCWRQIPDKGLFFGLLAVWLALFQFLGNSTLGYVNTPSLFLWLEWIYKNAADDEHGRLIPFVVLGLFWWKRQELLAVSKRHWWPALALFCGALLLHVFGFLIQQAQVSVVAFFAGIYALMGLVWGPQWLRASFFPFVLFGFCVPMANLAGIITFPLRLVATKITAVMSQTVLGINVIHDGTRIFDSNGLYQYEVAAACSGIRSLTATLAIAMIYAFMMFKTPWKQLVMVASAFPLAVAANVIRLTTIIVAAEAFGQSAGNYVHHSTWLGLAPYLPAIGGILLLGHWIRDNKAPQPPPPDEPILSGAEQKL